MTSSTSLALSVLEQERQVVNCDTADTPAGPQMQWTTQPSSDLSATIPHQDERKDGEGPRKSSGGVEDRPSRPVTLTGGQPRPGSHRRTASQDLRHFASTVGRLLSPDHKKPNLPSKDDQNSPLRFISNDASPSSPFPNEGREKGVRFPSSSAETGNVINDWGSVSSCAGRGPLAEAAAVSAASVTMTPVTTNVTTFKRGSGDRKNERSPGESKRTTMVNLADIELGNERGSVDEGIVVVEGGRVLGESELQRMIVIRDDKGEDRSPWAQTGSRSGSPEKTSPSIFHQANLSPYYPGTAPDFIRKRSLSLTDASLRSSTGTELVGQGGVGEVGVRGDARASGAMGTDPAGVRNGIPTAHRRKLSAHNVITPPGSTKLVPFSHLQGFRLVASRSDLGVDENMEFEFHQRTEDIAVLQPSVNRTFNNPRFTPSKDGRSKQGGGDLSPNEEQENDNICVINGSVLFTKGIRPVVRQLFLFPEYLLIAKQKSATSFRLKQKIPLADVWLGNCVNDVAENLKRPDLSFAIGWPQLPGFNIVASFYTHEQTRNWRNYLIEHIQKMKRQNEANQKQLTLKIICAEKDYSVTKCLSVGNNEDASQVVQRLRLSGDAQDYQLCVLSGDGAQQPLLGHECPYAIETKLLQSASSSSSLSPSGGTTRKKTPKHIATAATRTANSDCHFILCEKKATTGKSNGAVEVRSHSKSKSPLLNLFRKSKGETFRTPGPSVGKLFGKSLNEVCSNDNLPTPIMDLLRFLYKHGPNTVGVFRKPGNMKVVSEVRMKLDSGQYYNPSENSVSVAAGTLKEYLRALPDCLLISDMYSHWMELFNNVDNQQRTERIKRLVQLLPCGNDLLLRHLVCVLYRITKNSSFNNMTSSNLATCIGPSLLWANKDTSIDFLVQISDVQRISQLVVMFIDNSVDIFGEQECVELFERLEPAAAAAAEAAEAVAPLIVTTTAREELLMTSDSDSLHSLLATRGEHTIHNQSHASLDDSYDNDFPHFDQTNSTSYLAQNSISRDSGLSNSNPQLYEDDMTSPSTSPALEASPPPATDGLKLKPNKPGKLLQRHRLQKLSNISEGGQAVWEELALMIDRNNTQEEGNGCAEKDDASPGVTSHEEKISQYHNSKSTSGDSVLGGSCDDQFYAVNPEDVFSTNTMAEVNLYQNAESPITEINPVINGFERQSGSDGDAENSDVVEDSGMKAENTTELVLVVRNELIFPTLPQQSSESDISDVVSSATDLTDGPQMLGSEDLQLDSILDNEREKKFAARPTVEMAQVQEDRSSKREVKSLKIVRNECDVLNCRSDVENVDVEESKKVLKPACIPVGASSDMDPVILESVEQERRMTSDRTSKETLKGHDSETGLSDNNNNNNNINKLFVVCKECGHAVSGVLFTDVVIKQYGKQANLNSVSDEAALPRLARRHTDNAAHARLKKRLKRRNTVEVNLNGSHDDMKFELASPLKEDKEMEMSRNQNGSMNSQIVVSEEIGLSGWRELSITDPSDKSLRNLGERNAGEEWATAAYDEYSEQKGRKRREQSKLNSVAASEITPKNKFDSHLVRNSSRNGDAPLTNQVKKSIAPKSSATPLTTTPKEKHDGKNQPRDDKDVSEISNSAILLEHSNSDRCARRLKTAESGTAKIDSTDKHQIHEVRNGMEDVNARREPNKRAMDDQEKKVSEEKKRNYVAGNKIRTKEMVPEYAYPGYEGTNGMYRLREAIDKKTEDQAKRVNKEKERHYDVGARIRSDGIRLEFAETSDWEQLENLPIPSRPKLPDMKTNGRTMELKPHQKSRTTTDNKLSTENAQISIVKPVEVKVFVPKVIVLSRPELRDTNEILPRNRTVTRSMRNITAARDMSLKREDENKLTRRFTDLPRRRNINIDPDVKYADTSKRQMENGKFKSLSEERNNPNNYDVKRGDIGKPKTGSERHLFKSLSEERDDDRNFSHREVVRSGQEFPLKQTDVRYLTDATQGSRYIQPRYQERYRGDPPHLDMGRKDREFLTVNAAMPTKAGEQHLKAESIDRPTSDKNMLSHQNILMPQHPVVEKERRRARDEAYVEGSKSRSKESENFVHRRYTEIPRRTEAGIVEECSVYETERYQKTSERLERPNDQVYEGGRSAYRNKMTHTFQNGVSREPSTKERDATGREKTSTTVQEPSERQMRPVYSTTSSQHAYLAPRMGVPKDVNTAPDGQPERNYMGVPKNNCSDVPKNDTVSDTNHFVRKEWNEMDSSKDYNTVSGSDRYLPQERNIHTQAALYQNSRTTLADSNHITVVEITDRGSYISQRLYKESPLPVRKTIQPRPRPLENSDYALHTDSDIYYDRHERIVPSSQRHVHEISRDDSFIQRARNNQSDR